MSKGAEQLGRIEQAMKEALKKHPEGSAAAADEAGRILREQQQKRS